MFLVPGHSEHLVTFQLPNDPSRMVKVTNGFVSRSGAFNGPVPHIIVVNLSSKTRILVNFVHVLPWYRTCVCV